MHCEYIGTFDEIHNLLCDQSRQRNTITILFMKDNHMKI